MKETEQLIRTIEAAIERFFASSRMREEKLQGANEMLAFLAHLNRQVAENRGVGKDSELTIPGWLLRIPTYIKKQILLEGNPDAILSLLEDETE